MDFTSVLGNMVSGKWIAIINGAVEISIVILIGLLAYWAAKKWLARLVIKLTNKTNANWDNLMFTPQFFNRLGLLIAPITILTALSTIEWEHMEMLLKLIRVWITLASVMLLSTILEGANRIYESFPVSRNKPIKVIIQIIMIFMWCAALMFVISIFSGKPVTILLGGLTAFAAVQIGRASCRERV